MTPVLSMIQTKTYSLSTEGRLHPAMWTLFSILNNVHGVWRWYRQFELYRNPNNFLQLLSGHTLNFAVGDYAIVRLAAQCICVATRMMDCVKQQAIVYEAGNRCIDAIAGHYPAPVKYSWPKGDVKVLSPSSVQWMKVRTQKVADQTTRISKTALTFFKELGILSMKIMDVMDVIYWTPETGRRVVNESFVNLSKWVNEAAENKEEILDGMKKNREVIEVLLTGTSLNYDLLYQGVNASLNGAERVQNVITTTNKSTLRKIKMTLKRIFS